MPIRINLLAEEQAADELRRKDPLKRAIFIAATVVGLVVLFAIYNSFGVSSSNKALAAAQADYKAVSGEEETLKSMRIQTGDLESKLFALHRLATNRFLWAPVLNELQHCMVDGVKVTQFETSQEYSITPAVPARTDVKQAFVPAKSREQISLRISGEDTRDKYIEFMDNIAKKLKNLRSRSGVKLDQRTEPIRQARETNSYRVIVIECFYPEVEREQ